jgi:hypothetical protein
LTIALLCALLPRPAHAQGELVVRGNYWRDRNTRVIQPTVEISKELPTGTIIGAHYLLDAITSASVAAGVLRDQPFTELRNEVGFNLQQRFRNWIFGAGYSYSAESDYWAHTLTTAAAVELFQKTTTLGLTTSYGSDSVAQRMGPTLYNPLGGLQTFRLVASWSQVLTKTLVLNLNYELGILGVGDGKGKVTGTPDASTGWQANPYRTVNLGGAPSRETVPYQRIRQSAAAALYWLLPTHIPVLRYIAFRPSYRFYWDDWGLITHTPELRTIVAIGPTELRVTGRFYTQNAASFWSQTKDGLPFYPGGLGLHCTTCALGASQRGSYFTADPKLGPFRAAFFEVRLLVKLDFLRRVRVPPFRWLADGIVQVSYGHYFNGGYAHTAFGDAEVAGLDFAFPL